MVVSDCQAQGLIVRIVRVLSIGGGLWMAWCSIGVKGD
jgi:hypothetical protein